MRGPLLSGPLGSASSLDAIARCLHDAGTTAVIGPLWLGEALSAVVPILLLTEPEERERARRFARRAAAARRSLIVAVAGVELPLRAGAIGAVLVESASTLDGEAAARWFGALIPALREGGRLIAADVTSNPAVEARMAGLFLASALTGIAQERPREGVLLTIGTAPPIELGPRRLSVTTADDRPATARA